MMVLVVSGKNSYMRSMVIYGSFRFGTRWV